MKIYNTNNKCEEEQTIPDQSTTLINNIGLTYPGTAMPLRPLTINEHNSIRGINQMGLNVINPHYGYNASGCCGNDTLVVKGNLSVTGDFTFGEWGRFHDVSANWVQFYNHSSFFTWGVHIIPKSGTLFTLAMRGLHTNPHYHVHWDHQSRTSGKGGGVTRNTRNLLPITEDLGWEGSTTTAPLTSLIQVTTGWTNNDVGDGTHNGQLTGANPATSTVNLDPDDTQPAGAHNHGGATGSGGACTYCANHTHSITSEPDHVHHMPHNHDHDHEINQDKCNNTHDHYIMDETRVWYEGWLYPGFGGYGNSTSSRGYDASTDGQPPEAVNGAVAASATSGFGADGSAGTDYDPSHNLTAYGAQNGIHDDGSSPGTLFPDDAGGGEYTGNLLTQRPRLGGWSDRSSFPSCAFAGSNNFEYGMAIATSIPFDGWLINDASGSPFRNKTIWPHSGHSHSHCHPCDQIEHHEHPGPSSRFSWMLGKYDVGDVAQVTDASSFTLTIEFYLVRCDPEGCFGHEGVATPIKIGTAIIKNRCGSAKWGDGGVMSATDETVTIKAGDGIGMFIKSNNDGNGNAPTNSSGSLHSPATFTLEVHRKY